MSVKIISDIMKKRSPIGDVGIEVEVEYKEYPPGGKVVVTNWLCKTDGSLRDGHEYVTRQPVKVNPALLTSKLEPLFTTLKPYIKDFTNRGSTHVHVNALRLTPIELANTCTLWWLLEELLMDECGEERKMNRYSLRLSSSDVYYDGIIDAFSTGSILNKRLELDRYQCLNLCALAEHGSVEYRGMRNLINAKDVYDWVCVLHNIQLVSSKKFKDPVHILDRYINAKDKESFIKAILGPTFKTPLKDYHIEYADEAAIKLYDFAYCHGTNNKWQDWQNKIYETHEKKEEEQTVVEDSAMSIDSIMRAYTNFSDRTYTAGTPVHSIYLAPVMDEPEGDGV